MSSSEHNMGHIKHLGAVAAEDVRFVLMREETYQGSWKRRGGVGAFMMLARKWDRLEGMLERPAAQYNLFEHITRDPSGADGSPLAEVRDLRRYLLLVEAEMVNRGVIVAPPPEHWRRVDQHRVALDCTLCNTVLGDNEDVVRDGDDAWWHLTCYEKHREENRPATPADGGHHEERRVPRYPLEEKTGLPRLDDGIPTTELCPEPEEWYMGTAYDNVGRQFWIVDRQVAPAERWEHLPRLLVELNNKEHEEAPPEYRGLYKWHEGPAKWIMIPAYVSCWGKEP